MPEPRPRDAGPLQGFGARGPLARYAVALLAVAVAGLLRLGLSQWVGPISGFSVFFPAIVLASWLGGFGPGLAGTVLGALLNDYALHPGSFFDLDRSPAGLVRTFVFLADGCLVSWICDALNRRRRQVEAAGRARLELLRGKLDAERAAWESESRFRVTADAAPAMMWRGRDGLARDWFNRAWSEFTGRALEQETGAGWLEGIHARDRARCAAAWERAAQAGQPLELEYRLRGSDGRHRWVLDRGVPRRAEDGGWVGSTLDIDERKAHERERERLLRRAEEARGAAEAASRAKDAFLASVSHALRNPLNAIVGWAHLLRRGALDDAEAEQALETIERNGRVQAQLIDGLLDVSRLVAGDVRIGEAQVDLAAVVQAALAALSGPAASKGLALESIVEPVGFVAGDAGRLQQALQHLLDNALEFTPIGGRIEVRLARRDGKAELVVHDTGVGIPADSLPQIFDPFRRLETSSRREPGGGMGLGLTIARRIVELHGGTIQALSPGRGQGTTITVRLPLVRELSNPGRAAERGATPTLRGVTVLVVEDDADSLEGIRRILELQGAEVLPASGVAEAVARLARSRPDVVLSDLEMPERDGYEMIRELRSRAPEDGGRTPAAAVSAHALREDLERAVEAGFDRHLAKPIDPQAIVELVAELASRRLPPPANDETH